MTLNMKYSSRFFLYAPVAAFALLFAGVCAHWAWSAHTLSQRLDALNGQAVMPGVTLHFAQKEMAGFPFRLDAVFKNLEIAVDTDHGPAIWRSEDFALHSLNYGPPRQVFEAAGKQTLLWTDAKGVHKSFAFVPGSLRASALEDETGLTRFDFDLIDLGSSDLQAGRLQFHIRRDGDAFEFVIDNAGLQLAHILSPAFGEAIKSLKLSGRITEAATLDSLRAGRTDWRNALDNWRNQQGAVELAEGQIAWDRFSLGISGGLLLDEAKRPRGILYLKVSDVSVLVEELARRGVSQGNNNGLAAALLANIGDRVSETGEFPVTLAFKDGIAFAEQTPFAMLQPAY